MMPVKVLTNEKRGGLTVILFDRSRFQLLTLKFSNKSVQSSSCERPKTVQRLLISNDRNRVRGVVLGLSEDRACTDLSENLGVNNLKGDLPNATTSKFQPTFFLIFQYLAAK